MTKEYKKRFNTLNVVILVDGKAFRPIFEDNGHGLFYSTDNKKIQVAIEESPYFGKSIWCFGSKPYTEEEREEIKNGKKITDEVKKVDNADNEEDTSSYEKVETVTSVQKALAFFDARGIGYTKPMTVSAVKNLAKKNHILFVNYK